MKTFLSMTAIAVSLGACATAKTASTEALPLPAQNANYVVGENPALPVATPEKAVGDDLAGVKRVYWYFAGR